MCVPRPPAMLIALAVHLARSPSRAKKPGGPSSNVLTNQEALCGVMDIIYTKSLKFVCYNVLGTR